MSGINLLCKDFKSMVVVAPSAGYTAGQMVKIHDTVGVIVEDADSGENAVLIYEAEKIQVPKGTATADVFAVGDFVYFDAADEEVNASSGGNTLCGRAVEAADADDTTVVISLNGAAAA